ncbi:hypothetical protein FB451DRAFT_1415416 [Mycena latifolia]|nr:hypothetical protein FB451DRAFT_1415416 [Mycena latifolia]
MKKHIVTVVRLPLDCSLNLTEIIDHHIAHGNRGAFFAFADGAGPITEASVPRAGRAGAAIAALTDVVLYHALVAGRITAGIVNLVFDGTNQVTFGLIIFFEIIELSLAAWLTSQHMHEHTLSEHDCMHFTLFASTWTIIFSALFLILFMQSANGSILTSVLAHLVFLGLIWIIWTAAAAAITQMLGGGLNCKTQDVFAYCNQLNALEGFAWSLD